MTRNDRTLLEVLSTGEDPEVIDWYLKTPRERFRESQRLWATFLLLGGSGDPDNPPTREPGACSMLDKARDEREPPGATCGPLESARRCVEQALRLRDRADLTWIDPPPERDGWTLCADALAFLDQLVRLLSPSHVIEFGAGLSTRVLVRACEQVGATCALSSVDHDPEFGVADTRGFAAASTSLTLSSQIAALVARDYGGKLLPTYLLDPRRLASQAPADLVLIDGPPVDLGGREGVLYQVLERCRPGSIVLLDDAARGAERRAVRNWQETLGDAIEASELEHFSKGMAAILVNEPVRREELWARRLSGARRRIETIVPAGGTFVLIESRFWDGFAGGRRAVPFVRRGDEDWGPPEDDGAAMAELTARRREGVTHFVLPWTSFWWTDCYGGFIAHLRERFRCVCEGDLLLAFDLQGGAGR
jgi:predicted O-methyltransferase YrrM